MAKAPPPATEIEFFLNQYGRLPADLQQLARTKLQQLFPDEQAAEARSHFLPFVEQVWPGFIFGQHHAIMADAFERIANGKLRRCIINLPPRHSKSKFTSVFLPGWYLGRFPDRKILEASHNLDLAKGFGRELRALVNDYKYRRIFSHVQLSQDSKATHRWATKQGGEYFAVGTTGGAAGRGGDLVIIDDPHSEQDVLTNAKKNFEFVWQWYLSGPRQRLQPGAAILVVMTRWGTLDLTGHLLKQAMEEAEGEQWEVIELPAILPSGRSLWPEFWSIEELLKTKNTLPLARWNAQYQQQPTAEEGALIKREWWRNWTQPKPPPCDYLVQSWDTAFSDKSIANRSACITWGLFNYRDAEESLRQGIILLDAWAGRLRFPELKIQVRRMYEQWSPDSLIVEGKATGKPLIQELWKMGIPVTEFSPSRNNDKHMRTNSVADMYSSGVIFAPLGRRWVDEVVEEMAAFPHGEYDDLHDAAVQGLLRIRQGGLIRLAADEAEEAPKPRLARQYY